MATTTEDQRGRLQRKQDSQHSANPMNLNSIELTLSARYDRVAIATQILMFPWVAFRDDLNESYLREIYNEVVSADGRSREKNQVKSVASSLELLCIIGAKTYSTLRLFFLGQKSAEKLVD